METAKKFRPRPGEHEPRYTCMFRGLARETLASCLAEMETEPTGPLVCLILSSNHCELPDEEGIREWLNPLAVLVLADDPLLEGLDLEAELGGGWLPLTVAQRTFGVLLGRVIEGFQLVGLTRRGEPLAVLLPGELYSALEKELWGRGSGDKGAQGAQVRRRRAASGGL